ncbi:putative cytochrome P450 [Elsinoe ampelina]|uniref:Putative cytochrome P450 n=1 Tax=Elsinoe ampelina TaxID=302913 RepID=A0A6A6GQY3_9PEZI|nr:putative cytochrome P450 [Elsinoe ampelina]
MQNITMNITEFPFLATLPPLLLSYCICLAVYRLYFHPLARFPGPRLAAVSYWYDFYYDWFAAGGFGRSSFNVEDLHGKYGPIVRITPDEIAFQDPDWYDTLFNKGRRDKSIRNYAAMGSPGSVAQTVDHELHKMRRAPLNPFFSQRSIINLESIVKSKVEQLSQGFDGYLKRRETLNIGNAFTALGVDVICDYAFGQSWGCLQAGDFGPQWKNTLNTLLRAVPILKHVPWLFKYLNVLAETRLTSVNPNMGSYSGFRKHIHAQIRRLISEREQGLYKATNDSQPRTVFEAVLNSDLPAEEKTIARVSDEALVLVIAGGETTAQSLTNLIFHLLANPINMRQVRAELDVVMPDPTILADWSVLERLPYLHASVKETLRISSLITNRPQMVVRDDDLTYGDWQLPAGTTVSMSIPAIHLDPNIFVDPRKFMPSRWLDEGAKRLDEYFLPFSRGSRACVGRNLAYCEIYLAAAAILRRFDMELFDTVRERDVDVSRDCLVGMPGYASKGVRIRILGKRV